MTVPPLPFRSLTALSGQLRDGHLSATELTRATLARIDALNPRLGAYIEVTADHALAQANLLDRERAGGNWRGPLHGIPIGLKDLIDTSFAPTTAGMGLRRGHMAASDATIVERLQAAGAVIVGKHSMTEGAFAEHHAALPQPVNPWNADYWTGVSSSGTGVAIAAGLCVGGIGSDTGGSIRFPSSANGVTGLKPSRGRVSMHGVFAFSRSLDYLGPMARSAEDVAMIHAAIAGYDPLDPTTLRSAARPARTGDDSRLDGLVLGVDERFLSRNVAPAIQAMVQDAIAVLTAHGARATAIALPDHRAVMDAWVTISTAELAKEHAATYPTRAELYGPALGHLLAMAERIGVGDLVKAYEVGRDHVGRLDAVLDGIDLLLLPVLPDLTPRLEAVGAFAEAGTEVARFTAPFNFSGHPVLTLPGAFVDGMPQGMQLIGRRLDDDLVLQAGRMFQQATDFHARRPNID